MVGSIRGAITVENNSKEEINITTKELINNIIKANDLDSEKIIGIFFSVTKDLTTEYPAKAARELGFTYQSLMCFQEMFVEQSLEKCIRVCILVNDMEQKNIKHVYLRGAKALRPDIN